MGKTKNYGIKARVFGADHLKSLNLKVGDKLDFKWECKQWNGSVIAVKIAERLLPM